MSLNGHIMLNSTYDMNCIMVNEMAILCPECKPRQLYKLTDELYQCAKCRGLYQISLRLLGKMQDDIHLSNGE